MTSSVVRTRFSPSPTGYFHVGGGRSVLYNWFLARQAEGGVLILRIEDTDRERHGEEHVDGIRRAISWLGLDWDEEYRQSERTSLYIEAIDKLVAAGQAYYCTCTREEIDARKPDGAPQGGYDKFCRERSLAPEGAALRFNVPVGKTVVPDLVRGDVEFDNANIEDFVIQRADGSPLFVLANTVDDIDMRITHVVRGEEHLPNTPKNILLWNALDGGPLPVFGHLSVIVNEKRQKLSKRRDTDNVVMEDYAAQGYLPAAMANYLALLGWSPSGDREIVPLSDMVAEFRLEDVNQSPAFFDVKKLRAFNGEYIRALSPEEFVAVCEPFVGAVDGYNPDTFGAIAPLVQTRVEVLSDVPAMIDFLFLADPVVDELAWTKTLSTPTAGPMLDGVMSAFASCDWTSEALHVVVETVGQTMELKLGKAQAPVRVAVTGRTVGPPLFESLELLGRDEVLRRLSVARARVTPPA